MTHLNGFDASASEETESPVLASPFPIWGIKRAHFSVTSFSEIPGKVLICSTSSLLLTFAEKIPRRILLGTRTFRALEIANFSFRFLATRLPN